MIPLRRPFLRLTFLMLVLVSTARGQLSHLYDQWRWVRFGTESGLPSSIVSGVYESGDHVSWVHTSRGFAWYDGNLWHEKYIAGLAESNVQAMRISPDTAGLLLTFQGMLLSVRCDTIETFPLREGQRDLAAVGAWRDRDGSVLILSHSGVHRLRDGIVTRVEDPHLVPIVVRPHEPSIDFFPTDGGLWLRSSDQMCRYDSSGWKQVFSSSTGYLRIHHIAEGRQGNGLVVLEPQSGHIRMLERDANGTLIDHNGEPGDLVQSVTVNRTGTMLMLYASGELRQVERGAWTWLPPLPSPVRQARVVRFMSNGDLWVGGNDGLFLCRLGLARWESWDEPGSTLSNWVNEIIRSRDGRFWIGTRDGICRRDPDGTTTWTREINGVALGRVTAIGEDRGGNIWIGSGASFEGTFRWDGASWKRFGIREGFNGPHVHRIAPDRRGRLWFLCLNSTAILKTDFSDEPGAFVLGDNGFENWGRAKGLLDGRVYSFVEDAKGAYWFGTYTGLSRFWNGHWTYWSTGKGMNHGRVFTLTVDSSDVVHFSHQFSDIGYIDSRDSAHYITSEAGLLGMEIWEVRCDPRGWIWATTKAGLACWNQHDWYHFGTHSGMRNDRLWPVLPLDSAIYIGTEGRGVVALRLKGLSNDPARVLIDDAQVEDNQAAISWKALASWGDIPSDQVETRYRLSGGHWSPWSIDHSITMRDLGAGSYLFEVQAKSSPTVLEYPIGGVRFSILPPLYLRPVFYIPASITAVILMLMGTLTWLRNREYNRITRENEARFRAQYKGNPIPTFTFRKTDGGFQLTDYNDAAVVITLGHVTKWVGLQYEEILPRAPEGRALLDQCFRTRTTIRSEARYEYQTVQRVADLNLSFAYVPPDLVLVHTEDVTERQRSERQLRESGEQLRALAVRLQSVREEERTRLSREIHDELGQIMTGLKMDLAWIRRRVLDLGQGIPDAVAQRMGQMNSLLEDAIHTVRKIASQLRPAILDDLGLIPAMEWQARDFSERTGIPCGLALGMEDLVLDREAATELFRIYQEMLTNVARHAQATRVEVYLTQANGGLELAVHDDGQGISVSDAEQRTSLGILGMEERAKRIGGVLRIVPHPSGGTIASVVVHVAKGEHS
jgi:signal transduction histidine kinase/ligand-binding sensor domain-containing protein